MIFFSDTIDVAKQAALSYNEHAELIDKKNLRFFLNPNNMPLVSYASMDSLDNDFKLVCQVLDAADEITYISPPLWSDHKTLDIFDPNDSLQGTCDIIMFDFLKKKQNVRGLDLSKYHNPNITLLADTRKTDDRQLWVAGGSDTYGVGVSSEQRYGALLSEKLGLPVSFLSQAGSSIEWAADQILRSDIRPGDLVVWGLTTDYRAPHWNSFTQKVEHVNASALTSKIYDFKFDVPISALLEIITCQSRVYKSIVSIEQVANYCSKIGAHLLILGILQSESVTLQISHIAAFAPLPIQISQYLDHYQEFFDLGTDNRHPGPRQHQYYADFCMEQMQLRGYI